MIDQTQISKLFLRGLATTVDSWSVSEKQKPTGLYRVGTIFAQEQDSTLSSKIDVFCNKYRFLMVEV